MLRGLIGSWLVNTLLYANMKKNLDITVLALVRNLEKANIMFESQLQENASLKLVEGDICNKIECTEDVDYIIHSASQTSSKAFVNESIKSMDCIINGTKNMLDFAVDKNIKSFIFLSTMEVYGRPDSEEYIDENFGNNLLTTEVRNCYPISKILAENMCICYANENNFSTKILRLTQTFGPGVKYNDERVFAEFARCVIENRDIILHTNGDTKRNYLYTLDAVTAIMIVLLSGEDNSVYNVANETSYCSILEMANLVADKCANNSIKVKIELEDINKYGYAPSLKMNLSSKKIQKLKWKPIVDLENMYNRLIKTMKG